MDRQKVLGIVVIASGVGLAALGGVLIYRSRKRGTLAKMGTSVEVPDSLIVSKTKSADGTREMLHYRTKGDLPIDMRVNLIQQQIAKSVKDPQIRALAVAIVAKGGTVKIGRKTFSVVGANCNPQDGMCMARAIYKFKKQHLAYVRDPGPHVLDKADTGGKYVVEPIDLFPTAAAALENGGDDCDGHGIVGSALGISAGMQARLKVSAQQRTGENYSHIWEMLGVETIDAPSNFVSIDSTLEGMDQFGTEGSHKASRTYVA